MAAFCREGRERHTPGLNTSAARGTRRQRSALDPGHGLAGEPGGVSAWTLG